MQAARPPIRSQTGAGSETKPPAPGACIEPIERAFPGTTGPAGVDRQKLGAAVFGDKDKLRLLESIVHPEVAEMRRTFLADNADAPLIVFDIPLLFEKTGQHGLDGVVVVSAPAEQQRERVLARVGMTAEKFEQILKLQVPDAEKRARADYVIDTGVSLAETRHAVQQLVHAITDAQK